ncbi:MAG: PHP domain-containing protein [Planctomycetota bacterium]
MNRTAVLLPVVLLLASCTTAVVSPDPDRQPHHLKHPAGYELLELRGQIHVHTRYSHDSDAKIRDLFIAARNTGCDFVIITDHDRNRMLPYEGAYQMRGRRILLMVGVEYSSRIGHLLDLFPKGFYRPKTPPQELLRRMVFDGGFPVVAHPTGKPHWQDWKIQHLAGMEFYNLASDMREGGGRLAGRLLRAMLGRRDAMLDSIDRPTRNLEVWELQEEQGRPLVGLGGSNAHGRRIGGMLNWDRYENAFSILSNRVWVRSSTMQGVEEAIRAGRVYVTWDGLGDPAGFRFEFRRGEQGWLLGEEVPASDSPGEIIIKAPRPARLQLYHNGKLLLSKDGTELRFPTALPGRWRAELYLRNPVFGEWKPWIITNPIRIRSPEADNQVGHGNEPGKEW